MLTNTYRVVSNGFMFRPERLDIDVKYSHVHEHVFQFDCLRVRYSGIISFLRLFVARVILPPCLIDWSHQEYTESWKKGWVRKKGASEFYMGHVCHGCSKISWSDCYPGIFSENNKVLDYAEFKSAVEAEGWIKKLDPEANILKGDFKLV